MLQQPHPAAIHRPPPLHPPEEAPVILTSLEKRLLNAFQRDLPLCPTPYAQMARSLGVSEPQLLDALKRMGELGVVSRVGVVFAPLRAGVSTLSAMAVPPARLQEVAAQVNAFPQVNHNYARENELNLWFVVTAADQRELTRTLGAIQERCGLPLLSMPMEEDYHIDLGFPLFAEEEEARHSHGEHPRSPISRTGASPSPVWSGEEGVPGDLQRLLGAVQGGFPLVSHPFAAIGQAVGMSEGEVLTALRHLLGEGTIRRVGVVVRHHELGYRSNAMVVWQIPGERVRGVGQRMAGFPFVTLCYRRRPVPSRWPYNLYCMIHGRQRAQVLEQVEWLKRECGLEDVPCQVLFSRQRFKQRGAHYRHDGARDGVPEGGGLHGS